MKTFIIAEVGVNHDGDVEKAKRLIQGAKLSGADAVKFQTFKADQLATLSSPKAKYQEKWTGAGSQYEMLKKLELSHNEFTELKSYSDFLDIEFMSTPFDNDSFYFLLRSLKVKRVKLSSGDLTNLPLIYDVGKSKIATIISTGGATIQEIDNAVIAWNLGRMNILPGKLDFQLEEKNRLTVINSADLSDLAILQCTTQYPATPENLNLRVIESYSDRYPCQIGFSDHSTGYEAALGAIALGATIIEKHITEKRDDFGPDHAASMEIEDFRILVNSIRILETALGNSVKSPSTDELQTIQIARKSLVAAREITAGQEISPEDLIALRPAIGLPPMNFWNLLGKAATKDFRKGDFLDESVIS